MLIRVVAHFHKENMHGIDELIRIDNLPFDLMFRKVGDKIYLKRPWEPDIEANIPKNIREHCDPTEVWEDLPREKNEASGIWQTPSDKLRILGVRLNIDSTPGMEMWRQVERILDRDTPRDQKVPKPKAVAPNQKDPFSLEPSDIPTAILRPEIIVPMETVTVAASVVDVAVDVKQTFECRVCHKSFGQQRGLWMHERKTRHKVKEPAVA